MKDVQFAIDKVGQIETSNEAGDFDTDSIDDDLNDK